MHLKCVLVGHSGSQCIVPASKYLTGKYLPGFDITYLNYKGPIEGWADYVSGFLQYLTDKHVIFSLDDYLIANYIDTDIYWKCVYEIEKSTHRNEDVVCIKLCQSTPEEHAEYPVTTQYCIWNREFLIWLLSGVHTPWEFELHGSKIFSTLEKKVLLRTCIPYFTNSSLSSRWEGVRLDGLKEEDVNYIKSHGLI
jgi:hypothetical protein